MKSRQHYGHRRPPGEPILDDVPVIVTIRTGSSCGSYLVGTLVTTLGTTLANVREQLGSLIAGRSMHDTPREVSGYSPEEVEALLKCELYPVDLSRGYNFVFGGGCKKLKKSKEATTLLREALPVLPSVGLPWWSPAWETNPPQKAVTVHGRGIDPRLTLLSLSIAPALEFSTGLDKVMTERLLMSDVPFGRLISPKHLSYLVDPWNVNVKDFTGRTILHECAAGGNDVAVDYLLTHHGANLRADICDALGNTALHLAVDGGHLDVVVLLLALNGALKVSAITGHGALPCNPLRPNFAGITPLQMALMRRHDVLVDRLLTPIDSEGAALSIRLQGVHQRTYQTHFGRECPFPSECPVELFNRVSPSPYQLAHDGNVVALRAVLNHPLFCESFPYRFTGVSKDTVLHVAVTGGHVDMVDFICDHKLAPLDAKDAAGRSALHLAAMMGHLELVEKLSEMSLALLSEEDSCGRTPLHWALLKRNRSVALYLAERTLPRVDRTGNTPLALAAANGWLDVVQSLTENGSRPDEVHASAIEWKATLPFSAVAKAHTTSSLVMGPSSCDAPFQATQLKWTSTVRHSPALWYAIRSRNEDVCEYLVDNGAFGSNICPAISVYEEIRSHTISAVERGMVRLAHKLVHIMLHGTLALVDPPPAIPWGDRARRDAALLIHAVTRENDFWLRWFLDRGVGVASHSSKGVTALSAACEVGNKAAVQYLLTSVGGMPLGNSQLAGELLFITLSRVTNVGTRNDIVQMLLSKFGRSPSTGFAFPGHPSHPVVLATLLGDLSLVRLIASHPSTSDFEVCCALWWGLNLVPVSATAKYVRHFVRSTPLREVQCCDLRDITSTSSRRDLDAICTFLVGRLRDFTSSPCHPTEMLHLAASQSGLSGTFTALLYRLCDLPRDIQNQLKSTCEDFRRSVPRDSRAHRVSSAREGRCFITPSQFCDQMQAGELTPHHRCVNRDALSSLLKIHGASRNPLIRDHIEGLQRLRFQPSPFPDFQGRTACDYAFECGSLEGVVYCLVSGVLPAKPVTKLSTKATVYNMLGLEAVRYLRSHSRIDVSSASFLASKPNSPEPVPTADLVRMTAFAVLEAACRIADVSTLDSLLEGFCRIWGLDFLRPRMISGECTGLADVASKYWAGEFVLAALSNIYPGRIIKLLLEKYQGDIRAPLDRSWFVGAKTTFQLFVNAVASGLDVMSLSTLLTNGCPMNIPSLLTDNCSLRARLPKDAVVTSLFVACRYVQTEVVRLIHTFATRGAVGGFIDCCNQTEVGVLGDPLVGCLDSPFLRKNHYSDVVKLVSFLLREGNVRYTNPYILRSAADVDATNGASPQLATLLVEGFGFSIVVADVCLLLESEAHLIRNKNIRLRRTTSADVEDLCSLGGAGMYSWSQRAPRRSMLQTAIVFGWSKLLMDIFSLFEGAFGEAPTVEDSRLFRAVDQLKASIGIPVAPLPQHASVGVPVPAATVTIDARLLEFPPFLCGDLPFAQRWRHVLGLHLPSFHALSVSSGQPEVLCCLLRELPLSPQSGEECLRRRIVLSASSSRRKGMFDLLRALRHLVRSKKLTHGVIMSALAENLVTDNLVCGLRCFTESGCLHNLDATALKAKSLQHAELKGFMLLQDIQGADNWLDADVAVGCAAVAILTNRRIQNSEQFVSFTSKVVYQASKGLSLLDLCGAMVGSIARTESISVVLGSELAEAMRRLPDGIVIPLPSPMMCGVVLASEELVGKLCAYGSRTDGSVAFKSIQSFRQFCLYNQHEMSNSATRVTFLASHSEAYHVGALTSALTLALRDAKALSLSLGGSGGSMGVAEALLPLLEKRVRIVSLLIRASSLNPHEEITLGRLVGVLTANASGRGSVGVRRCLGDLTVELLRVLRTIRVSNRPPPQGSATLGLMRNGVATACTFTHAFLRELRGCKGAPSDDGLAVIDLVAGKHILEALSTPDLKGRLPLAYLGDYADATSVGLLRHFAHTTPLSDLCSIGTRSDNLLVAACARGKEGLVSLILKSVPGESLPSLGDAFHSAARCGHLTICKSLLRHASGSTATLSAMVGHTSTFGDCAIVAAAESGRDELCLMLLEAIPGSLMLEGLQASRTTLLCAACRGGAVETVRYILGELRSSSPEGFYVATGSAVSNPLLPLVGKCAGGDCALLAAYGGGHVGCVSVLVEYARKGMPASTVALRQHLADAISGLRQGDIPTDLTPEVVELLLGTTPSCPYVNNAEKSERRRLRLRRMGGYEDPHERAKQDRHQYHHKFRAAFPIGWFKLAMYLGEAVLAAGAAGTHSSFGGAALPMSESSDLLQYAAQSGSAICARICGDLGIRDVDPLSSKLFCSTALHTAVRRGHLSVVQVLVRMGISSVFSVDFKGRTALDVALGGSNEDICRFLVLRMIAGEGPTTLLTFSLPTGRSYLSSVLCAVAATKYASLMKLLLGKIQGVSSNVHHVLSERYGQRKEFHRLQAAVAKLRGLQYDREPSDDEVDEDVPDDTYTCFEVSLMHGCPAMMFAIVQSISAVDVTASFLQAHVSSMSPGIRCALFDVFKINAASTVSGFGKQANRRLGFPEVRLLGISALASDACQPYVSDVLTLNHERAVCTELLDSSRVKSRIPIDVTIESASPSSELLLRRILPTSLVAGWASSLGGRASSTTHRVILREVHEGVPHYRIESTPVGSVLVMETRVSCGELLLPNSWSNEQPAVASPSADNLVSEYFGESARLAGEGLKRQVGSLVAELVSADAHLPITVDWVCTLGGGARFDVINGKLPSDADERLDLVRGTTAAATMLLSHFPTISEVLLRCLCVSRTLSGVVFRYSHLSEVPSASDYGPAPRPLTAGSISLHKGSLVIPFTRRGIGEPLTPPDSAVGYRLKPTLHEPILTYLSPVTRAFHRQSVLEKAQALKHRFLLKPLAATLDRIPGHSPALAEFISSLRFKLEVEGDSEAADAIELGVVQRTLRSAAAAISGLVCCFSESQAPPCVAQVVAESVLRGLRSVTIVWSPSLSPSCARVPLTSPGDPYAVSDWGRLRLVIGKAMDGLDEATIFGALWRDTVALEGDKLVGALKATVAGYQQKLAAHFPSADLVVSSFADLVRPSSEGATISPEWRLHQLSTLVFKDSTLILEPLIKGLSIGWDTTLGRALRSVIRVVRVEAPLWGGGDDFITSMNQLRISGNEVCYTPASLGRRAEVELPLLVSLSAREIAGQVIQLVSTVDSTVASLVDTRKPFAPWCTLAPRGTWHVTPTSKCTVMLVERNILGEELGFEVAHRNLDRLAAEWGSHGGAMEGSELKTINRRRRHEIARLGLHIQSPPASQLSSLSLLIYRRTTKGCKLVQKMPESAGPCKNVNFMSRTFRGAASSRFPYSPYGKPVPSVDALRVTVSFTAPRRPGSYWIVPLFDNQRMTMGGLYQLEVRIPRTGAMHQ